MNEENCFFCDAPLSLEESRVVQQAGLNSIIEKSKKNKDGKHLQLKDRATLPVHETCRKRYLKRKSQDGSEPGGSRSHLTRSEAKFDFTFYCVICGKDASAAFIVQQNKKPRGRQEKVHHVTTEDFKNALMTAAEKKGDEVVKNRISLITNLATAKARYHSKCGKNFLRAPRQTDDVGRPEDTEVSLAFDYICKYIEENENQCQFFLPEVLKDFKGYVPTAKAIKTRLENKYGNDVTMTLGGGKNKPPVICFRNTGYKILSNDWYNSKTADKREERLRIVKAAAAIIREDIRSVIYPTDTYPEVDKFLESVEVDIPETLNELMKGIVASPKKKSLDPRLGTKITSIAHAIISATRPRSFLSPILIGLGATLHKTYGSKDLLEILSSLGFCCTYNDARLFESSCMEQPPQTVLENSFSQFVFDNADVNIDTVDGANTFHAMGGLHCITPHTSVRSETRISKLNKLPSALQTGTLGAIQMMSYQASGQDGLKSIVIEDINSSNPTTPLKVSCADFMWIFGKYQERLDIPGWNGFMEVLTAAQHYEKSRVVCLPFLNSPPGNPDTIYSVLLAAIERKGSQEYCFVTFDQPLYYKAKEIVSSAGPDSPLSKVIVRLGGFHQLMSFMGSIGYIMDGSGLQDVLSVIFARPSTEKIMSGHAYSRAVRGHILVHLALAKMVLSKMNLTEEESQHVLEVLNDIGVPGFSETVEGPMVSNLLTKFYEKLTELKNNGPTGKLWVLYFNMVTILKRFIEAERSGNWFLHIQCVQEMLPYFHASGHFLYAKSSHLYLQEMLGLKSKLPPDEYQRFVNEGYFTIRRSEKFWSGIWTDMSIEQVVMRSMKTRGGGLSHGRGLSDSTLIRWVASMPSMMEISLQLEDFCGVMYASTEQHRDARLSRVTRDEKDVAQVLEWFSSHCPFPQIDHVMSISTGIIGDESITCHKALELGMASLSSIIGKNFKDLSFQRKNRVMPLKTVKSKVKIHDAQVPVNPDTIFRRMTFLNKSPEQLKSCFNYELAPYPLAMFDEIGMRKTKKSVFYDLFEPISEELSLDGAAYVIDGGFFLHRVVWQSKEKFSLILAKYADYLRRYYKPERTTVVFDGYPDDTAVKSTKSAERFRRKIKYATANVVFTESMTATMPKEQFLSNDSNKERLITMLCSKLQQEGYTVNQAVEDADTLIVQTAIDLNEQWEKVVIVGEDTDLLLLLSARAPVSAKIYMMKPGKGLSPPTFYSSTNFQYPEIIKRNILFLHAFSGCDTTSAFFRQGKMKFVKLMTTNYELQESAQVFRDPTASADKLKSVGLRFLAALYSPKGVNEPSLNTIRYEMFARSMSRTGFNLASLPPTNAAAHQHVLRTYHQVQTWCGNILDPLQWGWRNTPQGLVPITTTEDPAPKELLSTISCKCMKGCRGKCTCRQVGLKCSIVCYNCKGQSCSNAQFEDEVLSHLPLVPDDEIEEIVADEEDAEIEDDYLDELPTIETVLEGPSSSKRMAT